MKRRALIVALFIMAVAALLVHWRIHPFLAPDRLDSGVSAFSGTGFLASLFPLIDVFVVTALFMSKRTALYGYLLNGFIVIYGTVLMAHFSISQFIAQSVPLSAWIMDSTLPDIAMAWADFFVGKALFDLYVEKR